MVQYVSMILAFAGLWLAMKSRNDKERERVDMKIDTKADKLYVDQQDRSLHKRIDECREENLRQHNDLKETINTRFDDIKELINSIKK